MFKKDNFIKQAWSLDIERQTHIDRSLAISALMVDAVCANAKWFAFSR